MKKALNLTPLIIFVFIIFVGALSVYQKAQKNSLNDNLKNRKIVPLPNFYLQDLYNIGSSFSKKDILESSTKISLINIFASWCTTCHVEHQALLELANDKDFKVNIYGIAWNDVSDKAHEYLEKEGNPYVQTSIDNRGVLSDLLGVNGVPETLIVNNKGKILYRHKGNLDYDIINYVKKLSK